MNPKKSVVAVGKKKTATASVKFKKGNGTIRINSTPLDSWGSFYEREIIAAPFRLVNDYIKDLNIVVNVKGGGPVSQAAAARVAIARGLVELTKSPDLRKILVAYDDKILAGDSRQKEPCKPNRSAPRAKRQKSYR